MTNTNTVGNVSDTRPTSRVISFEKLHELSTENTNRFNQNIGTEKLLEKYPNLKGRNLRVHTLMQHYHHNGIEVNPHLRTRIISDLVDDLMLQDMSYEQFENLELPKS